MGRDKEKSIMADIHTLKAYILELDRSMPPNLYVVGDVETNETFKTKLGVVGKCKTFYPESFFYTDANRFLNLNPNLIKDPKVISFSAWFKKRLAYLESLLVEPKRLKGRFKITGLGRKKSITCEPLDNQNTFWCDVGLTQERFDALWIYYSGRYPDEKFFAEIEYDGLADDGVPINGKIVSIIIE